jgi:extradiol dioxygenase family protein
MPYSLTRPAPDFDAGAGLTHLEHFQMAYVTNDMDRARALFREQLGIRDSAVLEGENADGGYVRAEFSWVGTLMYELIHATGPGTEIFSNHLPQTGDLLVKHHHLGYLVQNQAQWHAVEANAQRAGLETVGHGKNALVEFCFVEVPPCGHYLEYLFATEAGLGFFESVPRN